MFYLLKLLTRSDFYDYFLAAFSIFVFWLGSFSISYLYELVQLVFCLLGIFLITLRIATYLKIFFGRTNSLTKGLKNLTKKLEQIEELENKE